MSSEKDNSRKFEKNNSKVALNVLYEKEMEVCLAYFSKCNSTYEK